MNGEGSCRILSCTDLLCCEKGHKGKMFTKDKRVHATSRKHILTAVISVVVALLGALVIISWLEYERNNSTGAFIL